MDKYLFLYTCYIQPQFHVVVTFGVRSSSSSKEKSRKKIKNTDGVFLVTDINNLITWLNRIELMSDRQYRQRGKSQLIIIITVILITLSISILTSWSYISSSENDYFKIISNYPSLKSTMKEYHELAGKKIDAIFNNDGGDDDDDGGGGIKRENATLFSLVRNEDLQGMISSIEYVESRFNKDYHYDWVFVNDKEFTEEFQKTVLSKCSGNVKFAKIPLEYWSYPDWIDLDRANRTRVEMAKIVKYGGSESYRHMCRFNSGFFYKMDVLQDYEYYWRVEPDIKFLCDFDYDPFKVMREGDKKYGFNMALQEFAKTIPTLYPSVKEFFQLNPDFIKNKDIKFISDDDGDSYNLCHFWSNFEIGALSFFKSDEYEKFFQYLDAKGGFFYERWGDAPVHTLAVMTLLTLNDIQYFDNTGYYHVPNQNCPPQLDIRRDLNCDCNPIKDFTWHKWSCVSKFFLVNNISLPLGVVPNHSKRDHVMGKRDDVRIDDEQQLDDDNIQQLLYGNDVNELEKRWRDEL